MKARETLASDVAGMSVIRPGCASHVTVCATDWKCHVTVAEFGNGAKTVTVLGSKCNVVVAVTSPDADGGGVDGMTVTVCAPVCVILPTVSDAVMTEVPLATPDTTPVAGVTVATEVVADDHVAPVAPANTAPSWSLAVSVSVVVEPTATCGADGATRTDVNTGVGPVPPSPLPPHARIAAARLPAAIARIGLRSMS